MHDDNSVVPGAASWDAFLMTNTHIDSPEDKDYALKVTIDHNKIAFKVDKTAHIDHAGSTTSLAMMTTNATLHASTVPALALSAALLTTTGTTMHTLASECIKETGTSCVTGVLKCNAL